MEIELIKHEKDEFALFKIGEREEQVYLIDYDLTSGSRTSLESVFFPYQVNHIADELKAKMIEKDNGQQEDKAAPLEKEIKEVCNEMASFLIEKNAAYGNSAAEPVGIFAKRLDTLAQIDVRIDDKLNRLQKGHEYPGDDTIVDLAGYLILRMIVARKKESMEFHEEFLAATKESN